jgi:hypothetical protein
MSCEQVFVAAFTFFIGWNLAGIFLIWRLFSKRKKKDESITVELRADTSQFTAEMQKAQEEIIKLRDLKREAGL